VKPKASREALKILAQKHTGSHPKIQKNVPKNDNLVQCLAPKNAILAPQIAPIFMLFGAVVAPFFKKTTSLLPLYLSFLA